MSRFTRESEARPCSEYAGFMEESTPVNSRTKVLLYASMATWVLHYCLISAAPDVSGSGGPVLLSGALTAGCLFLLSVTTRLTRMSLLSVLTLYLFVHFMMTQLEARIFSLGALSLAAAVGLLLFSLMLALPFFVASYFQGGAAVQIEFAGYRVPPDLNSWVRIVVCATAFPAVYFAAGFTILPLVREFYSGLIPPVHELMLWQWLRGFLFTIATLPVVLNFAGSPGAAAVVLAVIFPVLGGVAPLLLPNDALPADVRLVHGIEIGASYIVYGAFLALLLSPLKVQAVAR